MPRTTMDQETVWFKTSV